MTHQLIISNGEPTGQNAGSLLTFAPELLLKAQGIRVVFFDVDGVLTDGGLYFTEAGETIKRFHTLDGHGLKLLQRAGITPAIITGRDSKPLRVRLAALGVEHVHYGTENKRPAAQQTLAAHYVTNARGGDGAVRQLCDLLLIASGKYAGLLEESTL